MTTAIAVRPQIELEHVSDEIKSLRITVKKALDFVAGISTEADAREAFDQVKLAKEWAKIRKIKDEMHADLLRLETHLLRKMAILGYTNSLNIEQRADAVFLKNMTDEEIENLIIEYGQNVSCSVMRRRSKNAAGYTRNHKWINSDNFKPASQDRDDDIEDALMRFDGDSKEAIAEIMNGFDAESATFSIEQMTDLLIENLGIEELNEDWGLRRGLSELCRKAILDAPSELFHDRWTPKYVTCFREMPFVFGYGTNGLAPVRVPFLQATIKEFKQMVDLREQQARDLKVAAQQLKDVYTYLTGRSNFTNNENHDVKIGDILSKKDIREMTKS